ncbi:unnamed protein product [Adineta steineri]|uniref:Uncharacterized protein n=1 Tax=Adineta steineri TaxID=433720 RepID=A0A814HMN0_9BILA|nr:unnamed protein product [Adineta steineri]CAF1012893.1 unnamed protein product [Adineta steineri]CAF1481715.1 unnamed protein product [Adineta steineri]CAF3507521.1 unnamed protein product [Adineta steineri]
MPVIIVNKETNLWKEICSEYATKRAQSESNSYMNSEKKSSNNTDINKKHLNDKQVYDPSKHTPVFCNYSFIHAPIDDITQIQIDTRITHPACINYALTPIQDFERELALKTANQRPKTPMKKSPKDIPTIEYLEKYVYPILLKGIEQLLVEADKRKCLERKRSAFNALDYLTSYLYYNNPIRIDSNEQNNQNLALNNQFFENIPFVHEHFKKHPRAPLPKSLLWSEDEAALIIQSFYRGYRIRKQPEVQELRQWQREWRESNRNIHDVVDNFWRQRTPLAPV